MITNALYFWLPLANTFEQKGNPKIVEDCDLPLTGVRCVDKIITDLVSNHNNKFEMDIDDRWLILLQCVFEVNGDKGLTLTELAKGVTVEEVQQKTACKFHVVEQLATF
jgi:3-oxoacid CoA-transferase